MPCADPDPLQACTLPTAIAARRAVAEALALALAKLTPAEVEALNGLLARPLRTTEVLASVRTALKPVSQG